MASVNARTTKPNALERKVLDVLPDGVDLDLAQVTSAAQLMPSETSTVLRTLVKRHRVEQLPDQVAGRPRYRRLAV